MTGARACPGCGREYTRPDIECPCGYAERAVRFAERPRDPPPGWLEYRRELLEHREKMARVQAEIDRKERERDRAAFAALFQKAQQQAQPVSHPAPAPPAPPPPPKPARKYKKRPRPPVSAPDGSLPEDRPRATPAQVEQSWARISLTCRLMAERDFLEQRNNDAHRYFLRVLERVCERADDNRYLELDLP